MSNNRVPGSLLNMAMIRGGSKRNPNPKLDPENIPAPVMQEIPDDAEYIYVGSPPETSENNLMSETDKVDNENTEDSAAITIDPREMPYLIRILAAEKEKNGLAMAALQARNAFYTDALNAAHAEIADLKKKLEGGFVNLDGGSYEETEAGQVTAEQSIAFEQSIASKDSKEPYADTSHLDS